MPRNGAGAYTLPGGNPVVAGTTITDAWGNATMSDLASEITASLDRSGRGAMLAGLQLYDGAVGAPGLTFATETSMGLYRIGTAQIGLSILATKVMKWSAGKIEIGGDIVGPSTASAYSIGTDPLLTSGGIIQLFGSTHASPNLIIGLTANVERWRTAADGKFGIGVAPTTLLDVNGTITVRGNILANSSTGAYSIGVDPAANAGGMFQVYGSTHATNPSLATIVTGNTSRVMVSANGRVTVGSAEGPGKFSVVLGTVFSPGNAWDTKTAIFGGGGTGGNFGIAYDDASGAMLMSINPGVAWKNLSLCGFDISFRPQNVEFAKLDSNGVFTYGGNEIGFRRLPAASVATGAFVAADSGKCVYATAGVTIPNATMVAGDVVVIQNTTAGAITITKSVTNAYNTNNGAVLGATFTLGARGRCAIVFDSGTNCYVSGNIS